MFRADPQGLIAAIDAVIVGEPPPAEADRRVGAFARRVWELWDRITGSERPTAAVTQPTLCPICRGLETALG